MNVQLTLRQEYFTVKDIFREASPRVLIDKQMTQGEILLL